VSEFPFRSIPVTGCGGPQGCETSRLPHFLDSRLTDGGEVASLKLRPPSAPRKIPGSHFCQRLSRIQNHSAAGRNRPIEKSNDLIGIRSRDLLACSIVPQPPTLPRAPVCHELNWMKVTTVVSTQMWGRLSIVAKWKCSLLLFMSRRCLYVDYKASNVGSLFNDELEKILKEPVVAPLRQ
jgi:hypothetical protein